MNKLSLKFEIKDIFEELLYKRLFRQIKNKN